MTVLPGGGGHCSHPSPRETAAGSRNAAPDLPGRQGGRHVDEPDGRLGDTHAKGVKIYPLAGHGDSRGVTVGLQAPIRDGPQDDGQGSDCVQPRGVVQQVPPNFEYRRKRVILKLFDEPRRVIALGKPLVSRVEMLPGDPRAAQGVT